MTEREKEIVASFKPWMAAYKRQDEATMLTIEKQWCAEDDYRLNVQQWNTNMAAARAAKGAA
jgi:hypothetical protein